MDGIAVVYGSQDQEHLAVSEFVQNVRDIMRANLPVAGLCVSILPQGRSGVDRARIPKRATKDKGTGFLGDLGQFVDVG